MAGPAPSPSLGGMDTRTHRIAGWILIAGSLMDMVLAIPLAGLEVPGSPAHGPITGLNMVQHLTLLAGVIGLAWSGAAGPGRLARAGLGLSLLGICLLTLAEPVTLVSYPVAYVVFPIAEVVMAIGLILVGVAVLGAGRWTGWSRFTPLACGVFIPIILMPAVALPGLWFHYVIGIWGLGWLLLGVALTSTRPYEASV